MRHIRHEGTIRRAVGWKIKPGAGRSPARLYAWMLLILPLLGCEANLNLAGVNRELAKSISRTDHYQEMVSIRNTIVLVGSQGLVMTSGDQGATWQRRIIPGKPNFIGLAACPDHSLVALSFDRHLWKSTDSGRTWTRRAIPTHEDVLDIYCAPDGSYWVTASFSTLLQSMDMGKSWRANSFGEDALLTHIEFFDHQTGIAAGEFGLFYKTTDGGDTWQSVGVIGEALYPLAIHFRGETTGWVGGLSGVIMKTTDGGATWVLQPTNVTSPIYNFVSNGRALYAIGDQGTILALRGDRWQRVDSPNTPVYLRTGQVLGNKALLVAGGWGALFSVPAERTILSKN